MPIKTSRNIKAGHREAARLSYLRIAPRKVRVVADLIKGLPVDEAEAQLMSQRRRAAEPLLKLLRSAAANVKNNQRLDPSRFYIEKLTVDGGPMLKRSLPRARGLATPIHKKMSHVTMVLEEGDGSRAPRFKIVIPKKVKLPPEERGKRKAKKPKEKEVEKPAIQKKQGFLRRMFRRKAV